MTQSKDEQVQEIEQCLLATLVVNPDAISELTTFKAAYFSSDFYEEVFKHIAKQINSGVNPSVQDLAYHFGNRSELIYADGGDFFRAIVDNLPTSKNAKEYSRFVYEQHLKRGIQQLSEKLAHDVKIPDKSSAEILHESEKLIFRLSSDGTDETIRALGECYDEYPESLAGIPTGLSKLDDMIGGLHPGNLYVMAGRPGMGKSVLALTICMNTATAGNKSLLFTIEMPRYQILERLKHKFGTIDGSLPLYVDETPGITISQIANRARRHKRKHGLDVLAIDYLGLIRPENTYASKVHQIEEITVGLKALAKQLGVPVLLFSQLSRAVEQRDDKRPMLSDLRDSGSIEQDADVVLFIYREHYYMEQKPPKANKGRQNNNLKLAEYQADLEAIKNDADLIIAKNRHGRIGSVKVSWLPDDQWFEDKSNWKGL